MRACVTALFLCLTTLSLADNGKISYQEFERIPVHIDAPVVNDMVQDTTGLVWLCTNKGLYAYDGFTVYPCNGPGYDKLVQIQCAVLSGDMLWLGTDRGMLLYDIRKGEYASNALTEYLDGVVRSICCFKGKVYSGYHSGIVCYDTEDGEISDIKVTDYRGHNLGVYTVKEMDGELYFGTFDGLYLLEGKEVKKLNGSQRDVFVYSMCYDSRRECIWLGTQKGLWRYSRPDSVLTAVGKIRHQVINDILFDRDSNLVIGSDAGLYVYDRTSMRHLEHDSRDRLSLSDNDIESLMADRDGNTWLGTHDGVSVAKCWSMAEFVPLSSFTGSGKGLSISTMIPPDSRHGLWCGGSNGMAYLSPDGGESRIFDIYDKRYPLPHNTVHSMCRDPRNGDVWAATDGGVLLYDGRRRAFRQVDLGIDVYNAEWCHDIALDRDGKLWVGTFSSGVFCFDREKLLGGDRDALERMFADQSGRWQVRKVLPDSTGAVWILYYNGSGIGRIPPGGDSVEMFDAARYIGDKTIPTYMLLDSTGTLWAGYEQGVLRIDTRTLSGSVVNFPEWSAGSEVLGMAASGDYLWLTTSYGNVWQLHIRDRMMEKLPLPARRYTSVCYDICHNALLLGTTDGYCRVSLPVKQHVYPYGRPYFMTAEINGKVYSPGQEGDGPGISMRFMDTITLGHDENDITVSFSSMNFTSPESDQYAYCLSPVSETWTPLKNGVNTISFVNLNPGTYDLSVCLLDEKGEPSEATVNTLGITVNPPLFLSPVAFALYLLAIAGMVAWGIHYSKIKARLKAASFEKDVLMEQASEKVEFLTGISHDLKTPLSLIMAPVSRILMSPGNDGIRKQLEVVMENAERLNTLLGRMLDYKRDGSDSGELARSVVDLSELVGTILSRYMPESASRKIKVSFNCQTAHVFYNCDQHKMESVVDNLISNAFKYTPDEGDIHISLYVDEYSDKLYLTVTDSGIGIPENELPYIFQRFWQSSRTRNKIKGTGLGLYMAKKHIEAHGGSVEVTSNEGKGTSFIVELPFAENSIGHFRSSGGKAVPDAVKPYRILVVEDNEALSSFVAEFLSEIADVYTAWNGRDGVTMFRRIHPDLIIADMMMPIMDGLEFSRRVRADKGGASVPIIMLTARTDQITENESIKIGIDAFMPKPFNSEKLRLKVLSLLEKSRLRRASALTEPRPPAEDAGKMSPDEKFLSDIVKIIEENIGRPELNVSFLAEKAGVSTKQLSRKLKPLTGFSPVDCIRNIRIKKASVMLEQGHFTVAEVMYSVGFTDPSYFAKCFQREFGCTPSQYLKDRKQ